MSWELPKEFSYSTDIVYPGRLTFTGWIRYGNRGMGGRWILYTHYVNGNRHHELGPAYFMVTMENNVETINMVKYYINDQRMHPDDYWPAMFKRHKGTDQEAFVTAQILGLKNNY